MKGVGGFRPTSDVYVGDETLENLRQAFRAEGWDVDDDGTLQPLVLDGLSGAEYDRALHAYVRRAQKGAADAALVLGTPHRR